jgi:hypothetical protein
MELEAVLVPVVMVLEKLVALELMVKEIMVGLVTATHLVVVVVRVQ